MKAQITGAAVRNAGRHAGCTAKAPAGGIGNPPPALTTEQADAWRTFATELPWLNSSHRAVLQIAAVLRARLLADPGMGVNAMQAYSAVLSKLGATPADASRVAMPDPAEEEPTDHYFRH